MIRINVIIFLLFSVSAYSLELDEILEREEQQQIQISDENIQNLQIKSISQLEQLAPFSDIAVIQRKYLPRTSRFEFYPNFGMILNDAFFTNLILGGRLAYHFTEKWGIELNYLNFTSTSKDVTRKLERLEPRPITTTSLVIPESFIGLDLKWVPVYGKMAWLNNKIVPFDLYFSLGAGSLSTNQQESSVAIHLGVGQSFAISKRFAFRWDTSLYWYGANTTVAGAEKGDYTNLSLSLGASFFFPEAKYR